VNLLLDTHAFMVDRRRPHPQDRPEAVRDQENAVWLSAASAWEITIKSSLGVAPCQTALTVRRGTAVAQPVRLVATSPCRARHPKRSALHHCDPDRLLIAQAISDYILTARTAHSTAIQSRNSGHDP
jgi:PIN domain nuclease of toxin-antitoxin system